ncbi:MAG TPA: tRNA (adenosine(37)-N6)-dimethylallyltransferase MiaA [Verrucomicrobiae bacterium]|nr:tRNA (adenosine(37)-N6)-dimethylallyltransferase MiaA [Verrucomicrobiae bacterium]
MSTAMTNPIFLAGPTAVGKSEIALALAANVNGEIISVDSMQVYRGLDIGTAKPEAATQTSVRHHLIDVCDLSDAFDAAKFVQLANQAVAEICSRNKTPIFCGGTGFYFKAYLEGIGDAPPPDAKLRAELEIAPLGQLLEELRERDPEAFDKIDKNNPRRVIRAIEVIRTTGKPLSASQAEWARNPKPGTGRPLVLFMRSSSDLRHRIDSRVDLMFQRGLMDETRELLKRGLTENRTAMQAIGYRQVVEHLRGERGLAETIDLIKIRTRQFAKRQLTWFRRHAQCKKIELKSDEAVEETLERINLRI